MCLAVWGTGNVSEHLLRNHPSIHPNIFIDNNEEKCRHFFHDTQVMHPSEIKDWHRYFIIVAVDNYADIRSELLKHQLSEDVDFAWYRDWLLRQNEDTLFSEAEDFIQFIDDMEYQRKNLLFSDFLAYDKGICSYVNELAKHGVPLVLMSEAGWIDKEEAKNKMDIPVVKLPLILSHGQYLKQIPITSTHFVEMKHVVDGSDVLKMAAQQLRGQYPGMAEDYEFAVCYYADKIIRAIIHRWYPTGIILWNSFYAFHTIIRHIAEENDIPLKYMEFGNIPGTFFFESMGQMGESQPARFYDEFLKIPVTDEEYARAESWIADIRKSGLNRNVQPKNDSIEKIKLCLREDSPTILYAGQNDYESGIQPYTENSRIFHSPVFSSSNDAAVFLEKLCKHKNWNFIYKPHPMMMNNFDKRFFQDSTIIANNVNLNELIDISDVLVTILSTVSYIALIRGKPVVMLGYTQLKGKGCTYEAFDTGEIETKIYEAMHYGYNLEIKKSFIKHTVQMGKYYSNERNDLICERQNY